jgi:hypothetical protein
LTTPPPPLLLHLLLHLLQLLLLLFLLLCQRCMSTDKLKNGHASLGLTLTRLLFPLMTVPLSTECPSCHSPHQPARSRALQHTRHDAMQVLLLQQCRHSLAQVVLRHLLL